MAMLEEHRKTIYNALVPEIGKEATQAMSSQFPARDLEEPVTKEFLRAELAEVRTDIADSKNQLTSRMVTVAVAACAYITLVFKVL